MTNRKIQIFYASIGSGHLSAARSIADSILRLDPSIQVDLHDIFKSNPFNSALQEIFSFVPSLLFPNLYSFVWKNGTFKRGYDFLVRFSPLRTTILKGIKDFSPDLIICTHTFPCSVVSHSMQNDPKIPLMAVATDQYLHPYWASRNLDAFIAPNDSMKVMLIQHGMEANKIHSFGIPVSIPKKLYEKPEKKPFQLRAIVLAGSYRAAPYLVIHPRVKQLIRFLGKNNSPGMEWILVFGAAKGLMNEAKKSLGFHPNVRIFDFVPKIQELIAGADFIFTKPGGLTVAEALALRKPIILLTSGAGQENENTRFVLESKTGILVDNDKDFHIFLEKMIADPFTLKKKFKVINQPLEKAADLTAALAIDLLKKTKHGHE